MRMLLSTQPPWARMRHALPEGATIDDVRARFPQVTEAPALVATAKLGITAVPGYKALFNATTHKPIAIVRKSYTVVQYADALSLLDGVQGVRYVQAGTYNEDRRAWALAEIEGSDDVRRKYILLHTGHDGFTGIKALFTSALVACWNVLSARLANNPNIVSIRHTSSAHERLANGRGVLALAQSHFTQLDATIDGLKARPMSLYDFRLMADVLFPVSDNGVQPAGHYAIRTLFGGAQIAQEAAYTRWYAYQAVTEYLQHHTPRRSNGAVAFESAIFGGGAALRQKALDYLVSA